MMRAMAGFAFFLLLVAYGMGMIQFTNAETETMEVTMGDLRTISEGAYYGGYFENYYVPKSLNYSEQRAAYQLGKEGGGLRWSRDALPHGSLKSRLERSLESRTESILADYMQEADAATVDCGTATGYSVSIASNRKTARPGDSRITCSSRKTEASYGLNHDIRSELIAERYVPLGINAHFLAAQTKEEMPDTASAEGGATSACKTSDIDRSAYDEEARHNARQGVISLLTGDYQKAVDQATTEFPEDIELVSHSLAAVEGSAEKESSETSDCDTCPEGETLQSTEDGLECSGGSEVREGKSYSVTYNYTASEARIDYALESTLERLYTSEGKRYLEFRFTYSHPLG